jgi:hypothetical protein
MINEKSTPTNSALKFRINLATSGVGGFIKSLDFYRSDLEQDIDQDNTSNAPFFNEYNVSYIPSIIKLMHPQLDVI